MPPFDLTVMMYHYVRDPGDRCEAGTGIRGLGVAEFEAQLTALGQRFTLIDWPTLRAHLCQGAPLPPAACLLTFDDGLLDHYHTVFPILRARGVAGLFFALARPPGAGLTLAHKLHFLLPVLTGPGLRAALWRGLSPAQQARFEQAERGHQARIRPTTPEDAINVLKAVLQREFAPEIDPALSELFAAHIGSEAAIAHDYYLSPTQIAAMTAGGMHFGGHSRTHPWLDWISAEAGAEEIAASAAWLSGVEAGPWAFAYPYGGLSPSATAAVRAQGFAAAFTTRAHARQADPHLIGRFDGEAFDEVGL